MDSEIMTDRPQAVQASRVPLTDVRTDGGTQMRAAIDPVTVATYAGVIEDGGELPQVVVFYDGDNYWLADGFHRVAAYKEAGRAEIPADVRSGTLRDAAIHAIGANDTNGLPRREGDYKRAYSRGVELEAFDATDVDGVMEIVKCSRRWAQYLTREARNAAKAARDAEIMRLHEQGKTQREIAGEVGLTQPAVSGVLDKKTHGARSYQNPIEQAVTTSQEVEKRRIAAELEAEREAESQRKREERAAAIAKRDAELAKYEHAQSDVLPGLVLADPPWRYDFAESDSRKIENQYPSATVDEIIAHAPRTNEDCVLLMWATVAKLKEALEVMAGWGFEYKTQAVWDKEKIGMGYWFRGQHELLLVGTKGKVSPPAPENRVSSVFREPRGAHSVKPECVYQWIEAAFPSLIKLEMYCRAPRPGWQVFGNESEAR